jgi:hypothetical protein
MSCTQRIARHLWRMCFAFFIASASIFLARAHLFPAFMRSTGMLYLLSLFPLLLMIFWLIRIRFARALTASVASRCINKAPASFHGRTARASGF